MLDGADDEEDETNDRRVAEGENRAGGAARASDGELAMTALGASSRIPVRPAVRLRLSHPSVSPVQDAESQADAGLSGVSIPSYSSFHFRGRTEGQGLRQDRI